MNGCLRCMLTLLAYSQLGIAAVRCWTLSDAHCRKQRVGMYACALPRQRCAGPWQWAWAVGMQCHAAPCRAVHTWAGWWCGKA